MLGILSTTILPKFFSSKGFEEHTYRNEVVAKLRAIQLRAMQQTNAQCYKVVITDSRLGLMATDSSTADNCHVSNWQCEPAATDETCTTSVFIEADHQVILGGVSNLYFDNMGRPSNCTAPCQITVTGTESLTLKIEDEGYIHAL